VEALEIGGGALMWVNEAGENLELPTNFLSTRIAHRLHAGLYNGSAILVGERHSTNRRSGVLRHPVATMNAVRVLGAVVEGG
jgi:hypothetical protein